ncbi:MAG TPA: hypothetical protein VGF46_07555 [Gaiellales bacterium]
MQAPRELTLHVAVAPVREDARIVIGLRELARSIARAVPLPPVASTDPPPEHTPA